MITRIKTDRELIQEAARRLAIALDSEFDEACSDMVEALRYGRSIEWWAKFDNAPAAQAAAS